MTDLLRETFEIDTGDESEYAGGGFNQEPDHPEFAPELARDKEPPTELDAPDKKEEPETPPEKPAEEPKEPEEPEAEEDKQEPEEPEKEPEKPKAEEPPKQEPRKDSQYDFLLEQNAKMRAELEEIKKAQQKGADLAEPTDEDWAENPTEAARRLVAIERQKAEQEATEKRTQQVQDSQRQWAQKVVQSVPAFQQNQELYQLWNNIYASNSEYADHPEGPLLAAQKAAAIYDSRYPSQAQQPAQQQPQTPPEPKQEPDRKEVREDRTAKLKAGAMHGSGRHTAPNVKTLDKRLVQLGAQHFGLTEDDIKAVS